MDKVWIDQAVGLRTLLGKPGLQRVTLCSALKEPGRPWALLNLAAALKLAGSGVLLVDAASGGEGGLLASTLKVEELTELCAQTHWHEGVSWGPEEIPMIGVPSVGDWIECSQNLQSLYLNHPSGQVEKIDIILVNTRPDPTGAFLLDLHAYEEIVLTVRPERLSVAKTYQLIQIHANRAAKTHFRILVSGTASHRESRRLFEALSLAAKRSLNLELSYLGLMPTERYLRLAAEQGHTVIHTDPETWTARSFRQMAEALLRQPSGGYPVNGSLESITA